MRSLKSGTIRRHLKQLESRRYYEPAEYAAILAPYLDTHEILLYREYVRQDDLDGRRVLLVRHDIDHDHLTALRVAKWEHERGIRATYCVLHTAWYYGELKRGHYRHTRDMIETMQAIQDLGHEVNFHNNLVSVALCEGLDPAKLLREELAFFRRHGIAIDGTTTHGDRLCRELNYRNWEMFRECCDDRFGGPRTVEYEVQPGVTHRVELGKRSLDEFELTYEAYDFSKDIYHTDSGGRIRTVHNTRGRRNFGRRTPGKSEIVGILMHPVWWAFAGEKTVSR